jgi:hypothetical protein
MVQFQLSHGKHVGKCQDAIQRTRLFFWGLKLIQGFNCCSYVELMWLLQNVSDGILAFFVIVGRTGWHFGV